MRVEDSEVDKDDMWEIHFFHLLFKWTSIDS